MKKVHQPIHSSVVCTMSPLCPHVRLTAPSASDKLWCTSPLFLLNYIWRHFWGLDKCLCFSNQGFYPMSQSVKKYLKIRVQKNLKKRNKTHPGANENSAKPIKSLVSDWGFTNFICLWPLHSVPPTHKKFLSQKSFLCFIKLTWNRIIVSRSRYSLVWFSFNCCSDFFDWFWSFRFFFWGRWRILKGFFCLSLFN